MLRRRLLVGMGAGAFFWRQPASAQTPTPRARLALVIANSDYDLSGKTDTSPDAIYRARARGYVTDLQNPWFDAVRVSDALKAIGFSVEIVTNAERAMMSGALMRFRAAVDRAGPQTASIIYYAGHGIQLFGQNYLIGVGAQAKEADFPLDTNDQRRAFALRIGVPVSEVLLRTRPASAPGYNLIIIDACRDNPWESELRAAREALGQSYVGERGFGAMSIASARTIALFSTSPGQLAKDGIANANSPFTAAFIQAVRERGVTVDGLVNNIRGPVAAASGGEQMPWSVGRLGDSTPI